MMSHFGHEAIFTLDYTINENQMSDCLMPRETEIERDPEREREGEGRTGQHLKSAAISPKCRTCGAAQGWFRAVGGLEGRRWFLRC